MPTGYSDNLHSDWDTYIPQTLVGGSALSDALSWAKDLITEIDSGNYKSQAAGWVAGDAIAEAQTTATKWASDANAYVCTVVMPDGAAALTAMSDLYPTYYNSVIPTIELQIAKGGYRLANWVRIPSSHTPCSPAWVGCDLIFTPCAPSRPRSDAESDPRCAAAQLDLRRRDRDEEEPWRCRRLRPEEGHPADIARADGS